MYDQNNQDSMSITKYDKYRIAYLAGDKSDMT